MTTGRINQVFNFPENILCNPSCPEKLWGFTRESLALKQSASLQNATKRLPNAPIALCKQLASKSSVKHTTRTNQ